MASREQESCAQNSQEDRTAIIRRLNDDLRCSMTGGHVAFTRGVIELGEGVLPEVAKRVAEFDAFTRDNDPYGEHDFGSFDYGGAAIFWKIDYYDRDLRGGSPDPADPSVTTRVLTIMLASEY
jgi:hypothetical protein